MTKNLKGLEEIKNEVRKLMDDRRTGLRDSSDTNGTRMDILGQLDFAFSLGQQSTLQEVEEMIDGMKKRKESGREIEPNDSDYNQALFDILSALKIKDK